MLYSIVAMDVSDSLTLRISARPDHVKRLKELNNEGRLVLAGPNPAIDNNEPGEAGFTGSIIIAEFNNIDDANHWAKNDPYLKTGVYSHVDVKPFKRVLP